MKNFSWVLSSLSLYNINKEKLAREASQENKKKIAYLTTNCGQIVKLEQFVCSKWGGAQTYLWSPTCASGGRTCPLPLSPTPLYPKSSQSILYFGLGDVSKLQDWDGSHLWKSLTGSAIKLDKITNIFSLQHVTTKTCIWTLVHKLHSKTSVKNVPVVRMGSYIAAREFILPCMNSYTGIAHAAYL